MSYWFRNDNRLPQERLAAASYVIVGMITLLLLGFWKLQVIDSDKYGVMAERNRVRSIPVIAARGRMLDRDAASSWTTILRLASCCCATIWPRWKRASR